MKLKRNTPQLQDYALQTLIIGGSNKALDYQEFVEFLQSYHRRIPDFQVIALPETGWEIAETIKADWVHKVPNLGEALELANQITQPFRAVLLSPAAASFNQYHDYIERGEHFKKLVAELSSKN